jgi:hypothetical protein
MTTALMRAAGLGWQKRLMEVVGAWKVTESNGGGDVTRAPRAFVLEGCGLRRPDIVK